jgi:hypothetical protein
MSKVILKPGDILVQQKGEPWVSLARAFTGYPHPHTRYVCDISLQGTVWTMEETPKGPQRTRLDNDPRDYIIRRPKNISYDQIMGATKWMEDRVGGRYAYERLAVIVIGTRARYGLDKKFNDDDVSLDNRPMICSEYNATGLYRQGYDPVPHVNNRNTLPWDFLHPACPLITI